MTLRSRLNALERRHGSGMVTVISEEWEGEPEPRWYIPLSRGEGEVWKMLHRRAEFEAFCREHTVNWRRYVYCDDPDAADEP